MEGSLFSVKMYSPIFTTIWKYRVVSRTRFYSFSHNVQHPKFSASNVHTSEVPISTSALIDGNVFIQKWPPFICSFRMMLPLSLQLIICCCPSRRRISSPVCFSSHLLMLHCSFDIFSLRFELPLRIYLQNVATVSGSTFSLICATLSLSRFRTARSYCSSKSNLWSCVLSHCWDRCRFTLSWSICSLCSAIICSRHESSFFYFIVHLLPVHSHSLPLLWQLLWYCFIVPLFSVSGHSLSLVWQ